MKMVFSEWKVHDTHKCAEVNIINISKIPHYHHDNKYLNKIHIHTKNGYCFLHFHVASYTLSKMFFNLPEWFQKPKKECIPECNFTFQKEKGCAGSNSQEK